MGQLAWIARQARADQLPENRHVVPGLAVPGQAPEQVDPERIRAGHPRREQELVEGGGPAGRRGGPGRLSRHRPDRRGGQHMTGPVADHRDPPGIGRQDDVPAAHPVLPQRQRIRPPADRDPRRLRSQAAERDAYRHAEGTGRRRRGPGVASP